MNITIPTKEGDVIQVGGQCYQFLGFKDGVATHAGADAVFDTCVDCEQGSSAQDTSSAQDISSAAAGDPPIIPVAGKFYQCSGHYNLVNSDACAIDGNTIYVECFEAVGDEILANEAIFPCKDRYWSGMAYYGEMTEILAGPFDSFPESICP